MNRRAVILFVLLLCVPTLLAAGAAFKLLLHERERLAGQALAAEESRLRAVAESLQLTVATVEDELTVQLRDMAGESLEAALTAWRDSNPLIRHVFVWHPTGGLLYPRLDASCTREERRFVSRYDAFFAGNRPWDAGASGGARARAEAEGGGKSELVEQVREMRQAGQKLASLARRRDGTAPSRVEAVAAGPARDGWLPWLADNELSLLGWVRSDDDTVYGVEVEFTALLSRLVTVFPRAVPPGGVRALVDGSGRVMHQAGDTELASGARPAAAVSLSPYLPHWQVVAHFPHGAPGAASARTFLLLAGLVLGALVVAVLAGGALLARAAHQSERDARLKTTFVSNVSHELKTPLTSIRMYAEMLSQNRVPDPAKRARHLQVIAEESERLTRLVNNVLDFSRLEQGRRQYRRESVDLGAFLRAFAEAGRVRIENAGLALDVRAPEGPLIACTDRDALEQALLNLVDNAIKYAAAGRELSLLLAAADGGPRLAVCDRGPGVPTRERERIFEKFYRADDSITAGQPGAGLGLSIARALMREQGGELRYEPRPGGGGCFVIEIPGGAP